MKEKELIIGMEESLFIRTTAGKLNITLNTLFQGVWAILLSNYTGEDDIIFGTAVSGRNMDLKGIQSMIGVFINSIPVPIKVNKETSLLPWLQNIQNSQIISEQYAHTPLSDIQNGVNSLPALPYLKVYWYLRIILSDFRLRKRKHH